MTAIITTNLNGKYLLIHGDTIVTEEINDKSIAIPEGFTTTQESLLPQEVNGTIYRYAEKACKIGILTPQISCGIAGDASFAFEILRSLSLLGQNISSREELSILLKQVTSSIEPTINFRNSSCVFQFIASFEKLYSLRVMIKTDQDGIFSHEFMSYDNHAIPWQNTEGSGITLFKDYYPNGIKNAIDSEPSLDSISTELVAADYINYIRFKNMGAVKGVGGVVLGLKHDMGAIKYMDDFMFMLADYRGSIEFLVKVIYRDGLFFITDFINKHIEVLRTVESEIKYLNGQERDNIDVTQQVKEALTYQAPLVFLDIRSATDPFLPDVFIFEDQQNGVVKKMNLDIQFDDGFPYFPKGTELEITTKEKTHKLVVKK
jgi:hypothetical protein